MPFSKVAMTYVVAVVVFLIVDVIWLGVIAKNLYRSELGHLMSDSVKLVPAILFYLLFVLGIVVFAVLPGLEDNSLVKSVIFSGLLGLIAYGTYDLTNYATLRDWPLQVVAIDLIWGMFVSILVGLVGYWFGGFIN